MKNFSVSMLSALILVMATLPAQAATIVVPPSGNNSNNVANNTPAMGNVWTGIAQSVTAVDKNVTFGFYLFGSSPSSLLYSLYAGDGIFGTALKQVLVSAPSTGAFNPILTSADFSDVDLVLGQRYTFKASLPGEGLPPLGTSSDASAVYAGVNNNPYADGRFYFTGSAFNQSLPAFSSRDLAFSMSGVVAAVPEPATWAMMVLGFGLIGGLLRQKRSTYQLA